MARSTNLERLVINNQLEVNGSYDNTASGLTATSVKGAIDEVNSNFTYIGTGFSGTGSTAGTDSIVIGENIPSASNLIGLGTISNASSTSGLNLGIGYGLDLGGDGGDGNIVIGNLTSAGAADGQIVIGHQATGGGSFNSVAVGWGADADGSRAVALGGDAEALADSAVQLGIGINNTASTLQYLNNRIANAEGLYTAHTATNYTTADADNVTSHFAGIDTAIGSLQTALVGGVTYIGGYNASTNTPDLEAPAGGAVSQGDMYTVTADGDFFTEAVTIGDVLIAEVDNPSALTDWTVVENNIEDAADVAYNNATSGLTATDVQTAIDEVEGRVDNLEANASAQAYTVNRETITANKTLTVSDDIYQHIISNTASLLVNLPASPVNGTHYIIKNSPSSAESFTTNNSVAIAPGNIYEVIYDGTEWVEL